MTLANLRPVNETLQTDRLQLRPLALADAAVIARLAGKRAIADTTISIPHPFFEPQARAWIEKHASEAAAVKHRVFALITKADG